MHIQTPHLHLPENNETAPGGVARMFGANGQQTLRGPSPYFITSSVTSIICQEGQSAKTFLIFLLFPDFSCFFPILGNFFAVKVGAQHFAP